MLQMNLSTENYRFLAKNKNVAQIFPMIIQIYTHKKYSIRIDTKKINSNTKVFDPFFNTISRY